MILRMEGGGEIRGETEKSRRREEENERSLSSFYLAGGGEDSLDRRERRFDFTSPSILSLERGG